VVRLCISELARTVSTAVAKTAGPIEMPFRGPTDWRAQELLVRIAHDGSMCAAAAAAASVRAVATITIAILFCLLCYAEIVGRVGPAGCSSSTSSLSPRRRTGLSPGGCVLYTCSVGHLRVEKPRYLV